MTLRPTCDEVQMLASEVAMGIASGDERALVLAHAKSCPDCRRILEELSVTADALLLLGPAHEPPSGFESSVLARIQAEKRPRRRLRSSLIAAALASILVTGAVAFWITSDDRRVADHYRDALAVANGKYFSVIPMREPGGERAGHVFAYEGHPAWVFLIFAPSFEAGSYEALLEGRDGEITSLGPFEMLAGDVTWGTDLPVGLRDVGAVRVADESGAVVLEAMFPSR